MSRRESAAQRTRRLAKLKAREDARMASAASTTIPSAPDWTRKCQNCGETPIVPETGLCGPCTFGEAETAGGNW